NSAIDRVSPRFAPVTRSVFFADFRCIALRAQTSPHCLPALVSVTVGFQLTVWFFVVSTYALIAAARIVAANTMHTPKKKIAAPVTLMLLSPSPVISCPLRLARLDASTAYWHWPLLFSP